MHDTINLYGPITVHIHIYGDPDMSEALARAEAKIAQEGKDIDDLTALLAQKDATIAEKQAAIDSGASEADVNHLTDEITALDEKIVALSSPPATPPADPQPTPDAPPVDAAPPTDAPTS